MLGTVRNALSDPEVAQAFAGAPQFFGHDSRPVDGAVLIVTSQGRELTVGSDCRGSDGCREIPPGVSALVAALRELDSQMLARTECERIVEPATCQTNDDCSPYAFCKHAACGVGTPGQCTPRPTSCDGTINPGCSCDGIYYGSECDANADGRDFGPDNGCMGTGRCADHQLSARGDCATTLGWKYAPLPAADTPCVPLVGCECIQFGAPCRGGAETPLYGSKEACERAHLTCSSVDRDQ